MVHCQVVVWYIMLINKLRWFAVGQCATQ